MISESMFPVPHDSIELEKVTKLLAKIPVFRERLRDLEVEIDNFAKKSDSLFPYSMSLQIAIEHLIFVLFIQTLRTDHCKHRPRKNSAG